MEFRATVELGGRADTGLRVPDAVVEALGAGRRPPVVVTVDDYSYRATVAPTGEGYWVPLATEHRDAAGVAPGQEVDVRIRLDAAPREVAVPDDLAAALDPPTRAFFDALAPSQRQEWVRWIEEARSAATRSGRVQKAAESLRAGKRTR